MGEGQGLRPVLVTLEKIGFPREAYFLFHTFDCYKNSSKPSNKQSIHALLGTGNSPSNSRYAVGPGTE